MPIVLPDIPAAEAARLLMHAQRLMDNPDRRNPSGGLVGLIERIGFVQVDSINIVERAHHHILWTRRHAYRPPALARVLERERAGFEHWTHDASVIPTKWFPLWRPRFRRVSDSAWWRERLGAEYRAHAEAILGRIRDEGPLRARDFEHVRERPGGKWWDWKPQKMVLEYLWRTGELMIARRDGFEKVYDLTERVIPAEHLNAEVPGGGHVEWFCRGAMERLVIATPREITQFWNAVTIGEAQAWCRDAAHGGEIVPVSVDSAGPGGKPVRAFALADWRERLAASPDPPAAMRILSPFDPVIRDRRRAARLFGFDYTFEAFTPAAKRAYGYYVLPVLEGGRFVARLDPSLDRQRGMLNVRAVWWEPRVRPTRARRAALGEALERYAAFCGADRVEVGEWSASRP